MMTSSFDVTDFNWLILFHWWANEFFLCAFLWVLSPLLSVQLHWNRDSPFIWSFLSNSIELFQLVSSTPSGPQSSHFSLIICINSIKHFSTLVSFFWEIKMAAECFERQISEIWSFKKNKIQFDVFSVGSGSNSSPFFFLFFVFDSLHLFMKRKREKNAFECQEKMAPAKPRVFKHGDVCPTAD